MFKYILLIGLVIALFAFGKSEQKTSEYKVITNATLGGIEREIDRYLSLGVSASRGYSGYSEWISSSNGEVGE